MLFRSTEVSLRSFNHRPDQAKGATTVTEIPDIKNIINLPGYGEMEREAAKYLPESDLISILKNLPSDVITKITERLEYTSQRVAEAKTDLLIAKGVKPLEKALENAIASDNEFMIKTIQDKIKTLKPAKTIRLGFNGLIFFIISFSKLSFDLNFL